MYAYNVCLYNIMYIFVEHVQIHAQNELIYMHITYALLFIENLHGLFRPAF